ncbi:MAG: O-antigen ligase family protein, partial [Thermoanaerobaculia bacterium]
QFLLEIRNTLSDAFRSDPLDTIGFGLVLLVVVLVPYPYGGIYPDATFRLQILAYLAGAATFLSRAPRSPMGRAWLPVGALAGLAILGTLQLVPLPARVLQALSPISSEIYRDTAGILGLFGRAAAAPAGRISIAPSETSSTVLLLLADLVLFISAALLLQTRARRRVFTGVLIACGLVQVGRAVLGGEGEQRLHGSFVNPNNYAGYLQLALALAFGLLVSLLQRGRQKGDSLRDLFARIERRLVPLSAAIVLWGTFAAALALSRSRGGILAAGLATLLLAILVVLPKRRAQRRRRTALFVALGLLASVLFAASITREGPLLRFLASDPRDLEGDLRFQIWRTSLSAARAFPIFGSGLGTFRESFRRVQPRDVHGLVEQAHSEPLQLLVTGGAIGLALGVLALGTAFALLTRAYLRPRHREESAMVLAGLGALLALTLHGLVEFNFSIPAVPATFAVLLGAAWAAAGFVLEEVPAPTRSRVASMTVTRGPAIGTSERIRRP